LITVKDMSSGEQTTASSGILTTDICDKIEKLRKEAPIKEV